MGQQPLRRIDYHNPMVSGRCLTVVAGGLSETDKSSAPPNPRRHCLQMLAIRVGEPISAYSRLRGNGFRPINFLEMEAVHRAVMAFQDTLSNQVTLLRTDNLTVASYVNKEGGLFPTTCAD